MTSWQILSASLNIQECNYIFKQSIERLGQTDFKFHRLTRRRTIWFCKAELFSFIFIWNRARHISFHLACLFPSRWGGSVYFLSVFIDIHVSTLAEESAGTTMKVIKEINEKLNNYQVWFHLFTVLPLLIPVKSFFTPPQEREAMR